MKDLLLKVERVIEIQNKYVILQFNVDEIYSCDLKFEKEVLDRLKFDYESLYIETEVK